MSTRLRAYTSLILFGILVITLAGAHAQQQGMEVAKDVVLAVPPNWSPSAAKYRNAVQLVSPPVEAQREKGVQSVMTVTSEQRRSHQEAVQRLAEIAVEIKTPVEFLEIGGWPALQRQYTTPLERTGQEAQGSKEQFPPQQLSLRTTTAVAVENNVVQFQTALAPGADPKLVEEAKAMVRRAIVARKANPEQTERDLRFLRERPLKMEAPSSQQVTPHTPGQVPLIGERRRSPQTPLPTRNTVILTCVNHIGILPR